MGNKKKSKSQKQRQNNRKKVIAVQEVDPATLKKKGEKKKENGPKLIDKNKVKYNVVLKRKKVTPPKKKSVKMAQKTKLNKPKYKKVPPKKENVLILGFKFIKNNIHILFNAVLILIFLILSLGLYKTAIFSEKINYFILGILLFFILIAISYNKYISGKIFTVILCSGMILGIYGMNYTYDYINCLNSSYYETKTYYVVTFDNNTNKTIYNLSNKTIGLLNTNHTNVEKILNVKLDAANYQVYEDINHLYDDFYAEKTRAIILNENQYYYLLNNIDNQQRTVKILFEFTAISNK